MAVGEVCALRVAAGGGMDPISSMLRTGTVIPAFEPARDKWRGASTSSILRTGERGLLNGEAVREDDPMDDPMEDRLGRDPPLV